MQVVEQPSYVPTSQIEEYRPAVSGETFDGPNIFPQAGLLRGQQLRDYLERIMIGLALEQKLRVVDIMNQPAPIRDMAGDIIRGIVFDNHTQRPDPFGEGKPELMNYPVKIRALPIVDPQTGRETGGYHEIKWKARMRPVKSGRRGGAVAKTSDGVEIPLKHEDVWHKVAGREAVLRLPDAYVMMKWAGKHCRNEVKIENQRRYWHYEEVDPPGFAGEQKAKGKK